MNPSRHPSYQDIENAYYNLVFVREQLCRLKADAAGVSRGPIERWVAEVAADASAEAVPDKKAVPPL